jgi:rhodanese-related sulfurtransferase
MKNTTQSIGAFQFENLITNRISFSLINLEADIKGLFQPFHQAHLDRVTQVCKKDEALEILKKTTADKTQAIIVICPDGTQSSLTCADLIQNGYLNCYYIEGGTSALRQGL